ncbi:MAG TPA: hypothetical protein VHZ95_07525 [Polyangiales bacterium]|nr:hypothetical protein [Polyangiales bacterium]
MSEISSPDNDGNVTVTGTALEGASIGVINSRTLNGVIGTSAQTDCDSACPFTIVLAADGGDSLRVWQFFEIENGEDVSVPK